MSAVYFKQFDPSKLSIRSMDEKPSGATLFTLSYDGGSVPAFSVGGHSSKTWVRSPFGVSSYKDNDDKKKLTLEAKDDFRALAQALDKRVMQLAMERPSDFGVDENNSDEIKQALLKNDYHPVYKPSKKEQYPGTVNPKFGPKARVFVHRSEDSTVFAGTEDDINHGAEVNVTVQPTFMWKSSMGFGLSLQVTAVIVMKSGGQLAPEDLFAFGDLEEGETKLTFVAAGSKRAVDEEDLEDQPPTKRAATMATTSGVALDAALAEAGI